MKVSPAVSLLLTNLQLLDYYASDDAFPISTESFTSLKNKGKAFEHIVHHLFQVYQPVEAAAVRISIKTFSRRHASGIINPFLLSEIPIVLAYI